MIGPPVQVNSENRFARRLGDGQPGTTRLPKLSAAIAVLPTISGSQRGAAEHGRVYSLGSAGGAGQQRLSRIAPGFPRQRLALRIGCGFVRIGQEGPGAGLRTQVVAVAAQAAFEALIMQCRDGTDGSRANVVANLGFCRRPVEGAIENQPTAVGKAGRCRPERGIETQRRIQQFLRIAVAAKEGENLINVGKCDTQCLKRGKPASHVRQAAQASVQPFLLQSFQQNQRPFT